MDKITLAERWLEKQRTETPQLYFIKRWEAQRELERSGQIITEATIHEYLIVELQKKDLFLLDDRNEPIYPIEACVCQEDQPTLDPYFQDDFTENEEEEESGEDPIF